ncbi:hypothetical protein M0804_001665 [Polistes exclamans]|nr:hypothetical protein M0804_001665 [Polistes exclamans]
MLSSRWISVYGGRSGGETRAEGCPVTMGCHGNRLHHLITPCIPHGCSSSLRAELHPADEGTLNFGG